MMSLIARFRINIMEVCLLLTILVGGAFSFYQVGSPLFVCGSYYAGIEIRYWLALSGIQGVLFLAQGMTQKISQLYRWLQLLTLPLVLIVWAQVAAAYPRIFVGIAFLVAFYWYTIWLICRPSQKSAQAPQMGAVVVETTIFLLLTIVIHSTIAFVILHTPGFFLDDRTFFCVLGLSAVIATWIIRTGHSFKNISIDQVPPLGLLIIVLLRAKFPDGAYDTLFYKATLPIMIADWRTAITGAIDHTLLGTNFFDIMSSQLRIFDVSYSPAIISSLSFLALWVLVPVAMNSFLPKNLGWGKFAANTATLLLVSLSEMLIAAGTAYHEPMLVLLVVASLLTMPISWIFLGAAVAGKITVLFICPLIIGFKLLAMQPNSDQILGAENEDWLFTKIKKTLGNLFFLESRQSKNRLIVVIVCLSLPTIIVGEQFYRNIAYTGRLLGVTETLHGLTDPENRKLAKQQGSGLEEVMQRGLEEKIGKTFIHILTLDRWITPSETGFHIMPSSRLIAVMAIITLFVFAFPSLRRNRKLLLLCIIWNICAFVLLNFFSQGRHLLPLSIGAAILVAIIVGEVTRKSEESGNRAVEIFFCAAVSIAALGDQVVGSFINNGWECRRNITSSVTMNNYDQPETTIERRLKDIVSQYRSFPASHLGGSPTILCESQIDRMHYLGAHYIYTWITFDLNLRHLAANPGNTRLLPTSLLALCFVDPKFPDQILPSEIRSEFVEVQSVDNIHILVSKPLMSGIKSTSLVGSQMNTLSWSRVTIFDFMENWELGRLTDNSPVDAPSGKGSFSSTINGEKVGFLISPYGLIFDKIEFNKSSQIEGELAMQYSNSDGMVVEIILEGVGGVKQSIYFNLKPKPEGSTNPVWEKINIPIPASITGFGKLTILAKSDGGGNSADWAIFRNFKLTMK